MVRYSSARAEVGERLAADRWDLDVYVAGSAVVYIATSQEIRKSASRASPIRVRLHHLHFVDETFSRWLGNFVIGTFQGRYQLTV